MDGLQLFRVYVNIMKRRRLEKKHFNIPYKIMALSISFPFSMFSDLNI